MDRTEFNRWLKRNPWAKTECKFGCGKPLAREAIVNGQDYHTWCLKSKAKKPIAEMAVHVGQPYPAQFRFNK